MNILKILGLVLAIHVVAFFLMFASPGCTASTQRPHPIASDTAPAAAPAGEQGLVVAEPAVSISIPASSAVRYSPTRPNTPASQALERTPLADVTPATTYTVREGDSLWTVAKKTHSSREEIARANKLSSNSTLRIGQKLLIPGKTPPGGSLTEAAGGLYTVKDGETLASIALHAGTTSSELKHLNGLKSDYVRPGQELKLPAAPAPAAPPAAAPVRKANGSATYTVRPGETLGEIARKTGVKTRDILVANNIADPKKIRAGQELVIPGYTAVGGGSAPAKVAAPAAAPAATPSPSAPAAPAVEPATSAPAKAPSSMEDLDAGLKPQDNVPVIKVDESGSAKTP